MPTALPEGKSAIPASPKSWDGNCILDFISSPSQLHKVFLWVLLMGTLSMTNFFWPQVALWNHSLRLYNLSRVHLSYLHTQDHMYDTGQFWCRLKIEHAHFRAYFFYLYVLTFEKHFLRWLVLNREPLLAFPLESLLTKEFVFSQYRAKDWWTPALGAFPLILILSIMFLWMTLITLSIHMFCHLHSPYPQL